MPKSPEADEFGRYRVQQDTGAKFSIQRAPLDGETVLDEPASDVAGDALPVEYPAKPEIAGHASKTVDELKQEIAARNVDRDEDDLIVPDEPGNKPELIAALEADDLTKEQNDG